MARSRPDLSLRAPSDAPDRGPPGSPGDDTDLMTTNDLPLVPQTGLAPLALPPDQEQHLLARRRKADQTDPFATDPDDEIRRLGRLALRRDVPHPYDFLALGDLCARRTLVERERRLLVFYAGKVLYAYRRAAEMALPDSHDRDLAWTAYAVFVNWLLQVARAAPSRKNIAVALWAVAEAEESGHSESLSDEAHLLALRYVSPPENAAPVLVRPVMAEPEDVTEIFPGDLPTHRDEGTELEAELLSVIPPDPAPGLPQLKGRAPQRSSPACSPQIPTCGLTRTG